MYCHKCGAQVDDQAASCDKCGIDLHGSPSETGTDATASSGEVQYAGFWRRLAAYLIDGLITAPVSILTQVLFGVFPFSRRWDGIFDTPGELIRCASANAVILVLAWLYSAIMESSRYQGTLGKMALGIVVTDTNGQRISFGRATGRHFGKWVSDLTLCIGYLMIAFTAKKQGLHDIMAKTLVVVKQK